MAVNEAVVYDEGRANQGNFVAFSNPGIITSLQSEAPEVNTIAYFSNKPQIILTNLSLYKLRG